MFVPERPFLEYCTEIDQVVQCFVRSASVATFSLCEYRESF